MLAPNLAPSCPYPEGGDIVVFTELAKEARRDEFEANPSRALMDFLRKSNRERKKARWKIPGKSSFIKTESDLK